MGNKTSDLSEPSVESNQEHVENVKEQNYTDPIQVQVDEYLKGTGEFCPIIKHTDLLGGMIRRRSVQQDTVNNMDPDSIYKLWQAVQEYLKKKTDRVVKNENRLRKDMKSTDEACERAARKSLSSSNKLMGNCQILHEVKSMTSEVQLTYDSLSLCVQTCKDINKKLPAELRIEELNLFEM